MKEESVCLGLMSFLILVVIVLALSSCTISMTNVQSSGHSQDVVDEAQTASPDVDANLSIPAKLI